MDVRVVTSAQRLVRLRLCRGTPRIGADGELDLLKGVGIRGVHRGALVRETSPAERECRRAWHVEVILGGVRHPRGLVRRGCDELDQPDVVLGNPVTRTPTVMLDVPLHPDLLPVGLALPKDPDAHPPAAVSAERVVLIVLPSRSVEAMTRRHDKRRSDQRSAAILISASRLGRVLVMDLDGDHRGIRRLNVVPANYRVCSRGCEGQTPDTSQNDPTEPCEVTAHHGKHSNKAPSRTSFAEITPRWASRGTRRRPSRCCAAG
jgi:hypothetical protein